MAEDGSAEAWQQREPILDAVVISQVEPVQRLFIARSPPFR
jgi:hypothetical protein